MVKKYSLVRSNSSKKARRQRGARQPSDLLKRQHLLPREDDDDDSGGRSGRGGGRGKPRVRVFGLPQDETRRMFIEQRELEQAGHRRLATVHAREKSPEEPAAGDQLAEGYREHPILSKLQQYDGVDPKVNPLAVLASHDPEIARELEKEQARQEHDKELRLSLQREHRQEHSYANRSAPTLTR
jgi:hypothetical protein